MMLEEKLKELRLYHIAQQLHVWLQEAARHEWPYDEFLLKLCEEELSNKQEKNCELRIQQARFPYLKTFETFDFTYQPSLNKDQLKDLTKGRWINHGENIIFLGPPDPVTLCTSLRYS